MNFSGNTWEKDRNGKTSSALIFWGINDSAVRIENSAILNNMQNGFTYSAWIKPAAFNLGVISNYSVFISRALPLMGIINTKLIGGMWAMDTNGVWG